MWDPAVLSPVPCDAIAATTDGDPGIPYLLVLPPLPNFVSDAVTGARLLFDIPQ